MSKRPKAFGRNRPTGAVKTKPSFALIACVQSGCFSFAVPSDTLPTIASDSRSSPEENRVVRPARQAYSHSASVGKRYVWPSSWLNHSQNATASFQLTFTTGWSSSCLKPGDRQVYLG